MDAQLQNYLSQVASLPHEEQAEILKLLQDLDSATKREEAQSEFLKFVRQMWPAFICGNHHGIMANAFERVCNGDLKRLIVNMPPRHTKSEFASYLLPAWFLGRYPEKKVIQTAHTAELAVGFGRKVRHRWRSTLHPCWYSSDRQLSSPDARTHP